MRIKIIRIIIIGLFLAVAWDLFYIQVVRGKYFHNLSHNNRIRVVPLEGWRGQIRDRQGYVLADNRPSYNVLVTPQSITDNEKLFSFLSEVLGEPKNTIVRRYNQRKLAPFAPVIVAEDIVFNQVVMIEENKFLFPSLFIQRGFKRVYPLSEKTAHILGYVGKVNRAKFEKLKSYGFTPTSVTGYSGVEEYYDDYLRGTEGGLQIEVNSRGQQVRLLSLKEPERGSDIELTIDYRLQELLMEALGDHNGVIIMMDTVSGEILGLGSTPAYDPNLFVNDIGRASQLFGRLDSPLLNRAIKGLYPPGSVFKVVVALAALATEKITPYTTYTCPGFYELAGTRFGCTHQHGPQDLYEAIAYSCNVYFYNLGLLLGADTLHKYAKLLGLGKLNNIDLPFENAGFIPSRSQDFVTQRKKWYTGNTLNMSIGQGDVLTTPLQLVNMMAMVAGDGLEIHPHVIKRVNGDPVQTFVPNRRLNISKEIFTTLKKGLRAAVSKPSGTAHDLNLPDLYVAGKTGTAQSFGTKEHHAWFAGYVESKIVHLSFCVFLEHGGSSHNATALARELLLKMQSEGFL